ncbi:probable LRR receptor-like serine/threonine-protein kinase At2g16250 [Euphorbia lathyris]|uniref:probable LRR receptor-like serine/threonine-protein kinase At2g16250 n=1 Tax=Euphorbia lathyris TaxID=212925 RepID=UPI00331328F4
MEEAQRLLLHLSLVLLFCCSTVAQLNSSIERLALLDLRSSLGLRGVDWPVKLDPCSKWNGVYCKDGRVTGINISGFRRTRIGRTNSSFSVDSLANLMFLESFNASRFALPGSIPSWFGIRLTALQVLDLRFSSVTGPIPDSLGDLTRLSVLHLSHNRLAGSIPSALGKLLQLSVLDLSGNSLIGQIPSTFGLLSSLSRLDLSSNYISGPIPAGLGNISGLQSLELSDNSITASVPPELGNLSQLLELNLSKNSLSGSLPVELATLRNLQRMEIGDNELEGALPDVLFSGLKKLQVAVLSRNKFDGAIPSVLLSLPNLMVLDLSYNNFTGLVPSTFSSNSNSSGLLFNLSNNLLYGDLSSSFANFSSIDLSGNYIQGKVPKSSKSNISVERNCLQAVLNQRSLENCRLFYAERGLSFDNFGAPEPTQPPLPEAAPPPKRRKRWMYILVGLSVGVGFIVILVLLMVVLLKRCGQNTANQRGIADVEPIEEGDNRSIPKDPTTESSLRDSFTYEKLLRSTGAFSEANLIKHGHSGDLFKGFLDSGSAIVVKRVNLDTTKKDSFMTEVELFNKYSHIRLVPYLGHCSENDNEKLLVYKYMPNGDLASSLYRVSDFEDDSLQSLDWITRLKIATGTAEGLSYLHHECNPPLVHRDIQASSILLDDKFEVRLGSLSEVRILEGDSHHKVLTRLLRKQQSSESSTSGLLSATCAYDVYCFGKVLLELITGKLGISKSDDATTREWLEHTLGYINVYDKELVTKILDPSLIIDEDLLEEVWAMAIVARSCLNPKPSKRPPMKYILKALENPLKVVRAESYSSGRLRTTSSRRSWSTAFFGSWRQSSLDSATASGHPYREANGLKQSGRVSSSRIEHSSSNKRLSNEIFPEPLEMQDSGRQDEH